MNTQYVYSIKQSRNTTVPANNKTNTTVPTSVVPTNNKTSTTVPTQASTEPTFDINIMENQTTKDWKTFQTNSSGIYVVKISVENLKKKKGFYNLTCELMSDKRIIVLCIKINLMLFLIVDVEMRNRYGYLSLVDYPALIVRYC